MIACVCNNISENEIRQAVALGVSSMAELRDGLGVATCCGKCFSCAKQVLNDAKKEGGGAQQPVQDIREISMSDN